MTQNKRRKLKIVNKIKRLPKITQLLLGILVLLVVVLLLILIFSSFTKKEQPVSEPVSTPVVTVEPTEEPEEMIMKNEDGSKIGTVTIIEDLINIRTEPSTDAGVLGVVEKDSEYDVFEIQIDGTYTWYKIGEENWIADAGDWISYEPEK